MIGDFTRRVDVLQPIGSHKGATGTPFDPFLGFVLPVLPVLTAEGGFLEILRFFVGIGQVNYHFSFVIRLRYHCVVIYCNCGIFPNHTLNNS